MGTPEQVPVAPRPEQEPTPEQVPENTVEQVEVGRETEPSSEQEQAPAAVVESGAAQEVAEPADMPSAPAVAVKDELRMQVERALEDKLWEIYLALPEGPRQRFKEGGEICATELRELAEKSRVNPRNVLTLIKKWLKLIPVVNKWFLWQEAKIKTDKFMRLHKARQEEQSTEIS